jgi:hypothetical protein
VALGEISPADALETVSAPRIENIEFARLDHHRSIRCGFPEVIFGRRKRPQHLVEIFERLAARGNNVLATRVRPTAARRVLSRFPAAQYDTLSRTLALRQRPLVRHESASGYIGIVSAGTADHAVAQEARITAEIMDEPVQCLHDVGVAGLERLLSQVEWLRKANVLVVVAGMEGALASVVAGLVCVPVIAVPTSVGYGASFGGIAALLAMLNSCATGLSVVNIDNGFGGAAQAVLIQRLAARSIETRIVSPKAEHEQAR